VSDQIPPQPYEEISTPECFAILGLCLPIFFSFDHFAHEPFRGFVAALSAGVVITLTWVLRPLRTNPLFWAILSAVALAHVALVFFIPYTGDFRFGFALFPVVAADIYFSARLIIFACATKFD
jgi:hypothetical protein